MEDYNHEKIQEGWMRTAERIQNMTTAEVLASLKRAGIIDENNKLTEMYKRKVK